MTQAAIDIVTTLKEPLPFSLAFVAHHLEQGVRCIHLYFDDPDDPAIGLLAGMRQVRVTVCDERYWARQGGRPTMQGGRPTMIVARQVINAQICQDYARSPWLLHCDADEFLIQTRYVMRQLSMLPQGVSVIKLPVWERCFVGDIPLNRVFEGYCRGPVLAPAATYGAALAARLTRGMAAYAGCKSITRVAAGLSIGIHDSFRDGPGSVADRRDPVGRKMLHLPQIVHVDGLTPHHAVAKMIDRDADIPPDKRAVIMSPARSAQISALSGRSNDPTQYFHGLRQVSSQAFAALEAREAIMPMPVDPAAAAIRRWPQSAPIFYPAAFDRIMRTQLDGGWRRSA